MNTTQSNPFANGDYFYWVPTPPQWVPSPPNYTPPFIPTPIYPAPVCPGCGRCPYCGRQASPQFEKFEITC